jgi:7,8-dihydropterin-6-yl-methyl-4-(beta-D-ribofuranosyl)aminobenzene 5'-phosphate synthase
MVCLLTLRSQETYVDGEATGTVLFDTGPNSTTLCGNMSALKIDSTKIDALVLSHWHIDHSGGILSFLKHRALAASQFKESNNVKPVVLDLHPDRPEVRGIAPPPGHKVVAALAEDPTFHAMEQAGGVVSKSKEGHSVASDTVWVSGEIPRVSGFEAGLIGGRTWITDSKGQGSWVKDEAIMDERYAAIDVVGKGLVVFSACSHAGIVNVLKDVIDKLQRPIYMVIGGLHLAGPELLPRIQPTIEFLQQLNPPPKYILPMHCSGFQCKVALEDAFGSTVVPAGVGMKVVVEATS